LKKEELKKRVMVLLNKKLWHVYAGRGTGYCLSLAIGQKIKRKKRLNNMTVSETARCYEGEFTIYSTCSWRLIQNNKIICTSLDSNVKDGPMLIGLRKIVNKEIVAIDFLEPFFDLVISFSNNYILSFYCDVMWEDDEDIDYVIFLKEKIFSIGPRGRLSVEKINAPGT